MIRSMLECAPTDQLEKIEAGLEISLEKAWGWERDWIEDRLELVDEILEQRAWTTTKWKQYEDDEIQEG